MTNINTDEPIAHVYAWLEHFIMTVPLPETFECDCCGINAVDVEFTLCEDCDHEDDFDPAEDFDDGYETRMIEAYEVWRREY